MTPTGPATVTIEHQAPDGTAFLVDVELAMVDGHVTCVALTVRGYIHDLEEQDDHSLLGFPDLGAYDREISSNVVRSLRPGELVTKAIGHLKLESQWATLEQQRLPASFDAWLAAHPLKHTAEGTSQVSQKRRELLRRHYELENEFLATQQAELQWLHESTPRPAGGGRPRIPDEKLKEVAAIYLEAKNGGDHAPAKAVSRHYKVKRERGRRWVMYARERGFLPKLPKKDDTK